MKKKLVSWTGASVDAIFQALHKAGCCTPLYAEFENGMVYGYVHGETLDATSIKDDTITK